MKLKQNENEGRPVDDYDPDKHFENRKAYEEKPDKKAVDDMWNCVDDMDENVQKLKDTTQMIMTAYKGRLFTKLKTYYDKYRKELMDDSLKKQE